MNLRVIRNNVLVKPDAAPGQTPGGIFYNPNWQTPSGSGTVLSVGAGKVNSKGVLVPLDVKPGDRVAFRWIDGRKLEWNGVEYQLLRDDELHGIVL